MRDIWPSAPVTVSDCVKCTIKRFFEISDSTDTTSGELFANELFTKDGIFKTHKKLIFQGREEIAASRKNNSQLTASRSHELVQIYASNSPGTDLVVLGNFKIELVDGNHVEFPFTARFIVTSNQGGEDEGKLEYVEVWTDPTDMLVAYEKASQAMSHQK